MKQIRFNSNMQNEINEKQDIITRINEILRCLLSNDTKVCKNCEAVDICSHLQAAVFCIMKNA